MCRCPALLVLAVTGVAAFAGDWPEFRGPTGQGLYEGRPLPTRWSATEHVTWKKAIDGLGWSSPAIAGGRIYLTTAVAQGRDYSLRALCLDADSGKTIWDREVFVQDGGTSPRVHTKNSHASPTPIVRDDRLYVHYGHQGTACLKTDGTVVWRSREHRYAPVHGNGGSPLLVEDQLIFSCDGAENPFVLALDAATGAVRWKKPRSTESVKRFSFCTPLLIEANGRRQIVLPGSGGVVSYDPKSGAEIWKVRYEGYSVVPRPAFGHGIVFLSTGYDSPQLLAIKVDGGGDVTDSHVAWRLTRNAPLNPSPLLVGDEVYVVSDGGVASCLDARSGKIHWQERLRGAYSASPMHADGKIYFLSENGVGTVIKAGTSFERIAQNDLKERTLASYAAVDGALYIRTDKHLYRLDDR